MIFITGGAYQGKLDLAKRLYGVAEEEIYVCSEDEAPDLTKRCVTHIERAVMYLLRNDIDPAEHFREHADEWCESILICEDITCGVVPLLAEHRAWREQTGRLCRYLSSEAERVSRVICGLEQRLK